MRRIWSFDDVAVWHATIVGDPTEFARLLSSDELARSRAYGSDLLRRRFIVRRGLARSLLSTVMSCAPCSIEFTYGEYKKPAVRGGPHFNVSSSGNEALFAISPSRAVGVDIQRINPKFEYADVLPESFSGAERARFEPLAEPARIEYFFRAWTRKEACVKCLGTGLSSSLSEIDVSEEKFRSLTISDLNVGDGYAAAVAYETLGNLTA